MAVKRRKGAMTVYKESSCNVTNTTKSSNHNNTKKTSVKRTSTTNSKAQLRPVAFCGKTKGFFKMMKEDFYGENSCTLNNNVPNNT